MAAADKISAEGQLSEEDHSLLITGANLVVAAKEMTNGTSPRGLTISADPSREDGAFQEGDVSGRRGGGGGRNDGNGANLVVVAKQMTSGTSPRGLTISADPFRDDGAFQEGGVSGAK